MSLSEFKQIFGKSSQISKNLSRFLMKMAIFLLWKQREWRKMPTDATWSSFFRIFPWKLLPKPQIPQIYLFPGHQSPFLTLKKLQRRKNLPKSQLISESPEHMATGCVHRRTRPSRARPNWFFPFFLFLFYQFAASRAERPSNCSFIVRRKRGRLIAFYWCVLQQHTNDLVND